jgi:beta-lactamase regulating signal transducer with metallopeptidase domain/tetratricopeptide (TPR) repeat protein
MNAMLEQIDSAGKVFVEFAWPMLVQSGVLIVILLLADFVLRKKVRAVFRYWLWMLVLVKLVLPTSLSSPVSLGYLFGDELANVRVTDRRPAAQPASLKEAPEQASIKAGPGPVIVTSRKQSIELTGAATEGIAPIDAEATGQLAESAAPITWQGVVFLAWLAVVVAMGLLLLQRAIFVKGLVAQAREPNGLMNDVFEFCCGRMGLKGKVRLKVSANAASPAVCGLFRPVILVPRDLGPSLGSSHLRAVLIHELAHVKRGDLWVNLAQTVLQIVYFYNPLLWLANAMIRRVREQAVDEMVQVAMAEKARQYPETLVNVAKIAFKRPALSLRLIGVVESRSALRGRIKHMLNRPIPKSAKLGVVGLFLVLIAGVVLLPMARAERFRGRLENIIAVAEKEARLLNHEYVGTEHILLALAGGDAGTTSRVFKAFDIDRDKLLAEIMKVIKKGAKPVAEKKLPKTPRAQEALKLAVEEAEKLGSDTVKAEYILLGLMQVEEGLAAQVLMDLGLELEDVRREISNLPQAKAAAGQPEFVIKRTVRDAETGQPVAGAKVGDVERYAEGKQSTTTDTNGNYEYKTWYEEHGIKCEAAGYKAEKKILLTKFIGSEKEKVIDFELTRVGDSRLSEFTATLVSGVTVELVGVCEHPSQDKKWWRPDGSLLEEAPYDSTGSVLEDEEGYELYEYALRLLEGPSDTSIKWSIPGGNLGSYTGTPIGEDGKRVGDLRVYTSNQPVERQSATVRIGLTADVWQSLVTHPAVKGEETYTLEDGAVAFGLPYEQDGETLLPFVHNFKGSSKNNEVATRVIAVTNVGEQIRGGVSGRGGNILSSSTYKFRTPLGNIKEFRFQTRPYEWVTFKNISLKPNFRTDVQIEVQNPSGQVISASDFGKDEADVEKSMSKTPVRSTMPRVVRTRPAAFADDVSPQLSKITVTFDRPMMDQSWSWTGGGQTYPETPGKPRYNASRKICSLPVELEAGKVYWVGINSPSYQNFKSADGIAAKRYVILFATKGADGKPTPIPEDMLAKAKGINEQTEKADAEAGVENRRAKLRADFQKRMARDRATYTERELGEIEQLYQTANKRWKSQEAQDSLEKLVARYAKANRTGCAVLYLGQMSESAQKERYLKRAIEDFGDCMYGDGVQVGAFARYLLAMHYEETGKKNEAKRLVAELIEDYPDAVGHNGNLLIEQLPEDLNTPVEAEPVTTEGEAIDAVRLQGMIDSARRGGAVTIPKGVYTEPVTINKSLILKGVSPDDCIFEVTADEPAIFVDTKGKGKVAFEGVTIKWQLATSNKNIEHPYAVAVKDSKAEVKNCSFVPLGNFKRCPTAIQAVGFSNLLIDSCRFDGFEYTVCYGEGTEGTIQDCIIAGSGHQGISLYSGAKIRIERNTVAGSKYHGVRSTGGTLFMKDNLIINNDNRGVYLGNKSARGIISNNVIMANECGISGFAESKVKIENNVIADSSYAGIQMADSSKLGISRNIICNNERGLILSGEGGRNDNSVLKNTFWKNKVDAENFIRPADSILAEPAFRDAENGDFSLTGGGPLEQKQGLTDPELLWKIWQRHTAENKQVGGTTRSDAKI